MLQGVQRTDAEDGAGPANSRSHHGLRRQEFHVCDEDAASVGVDSQGGEGRKGQRQAAYRQGRQVDARSGRGNREDENPGPHGRRSRRRRANHRRERAQHGHHRRRSEVITPAEQRQPKLSKRMKTVRTKVDRTKAYPVDEALKLVKETALAKFDESVDIAVNLGVDPKKSDQTVRGSVVLPAGTGKKVRVAVFAQGDKAKAAKDAGADIG